jgi:hypothetical protein
MSVASRKGKSFAAEAHIAMIRIVNVHEVVRLIGGPDWQWGQTDRRRKLAGVRLGVRDFCSARVREGTCGVNCLFMVASARFILITL